MTYDRYDAAFVAAAAVAPLLLFLVPNDDFGTLRHVSFQIFRSEWRRVLRHIHTLPKNENTAGPAFDSMHFLFFIFPPTFTYFELALKGRRRHTTP